MPCFWDEREVGMIVKIMQISLSHTSFFHSGLYSSSWTNSKSWSLRPFHHFCDTVSAVYNSFHSINVVFLMIFSLVSNNAMNCGSLNSN